MRREGRVHELAFDMNRLVCLPDHERKITTIYPSKSQINVDGLTLKIVGDSRTCLMSKNAKGSTHLFLVYFCQRRESHVTLLIICKLALGAFKKLVHYFPSLQLPPPLCLTILKYPASRLVYLLYYETRPHELVLV